MTARTMRGAAAVLTLAALAVTLAPAARAADFKLPVPEKIALRNGLVVYYLRASDLPLVSFRMWVRGAGSAFEPAGLEGTANMTADLLSKGAGGMTADQVAEALDFMGASLNIGAAEEYVSVSGDSLAEHFPKLMGIAADVLLRPALPEDEFKKEQARRIDAVKSLKDNPGSAVRPYFQKAYFGAHPMGNLAMGTEASLAKMTLGDVKAYYAARYRPDRAIAAVVGDIARPDLAALLEKTLGTWTAPAGGGPSTAIPPLPIPNGVRLILVDKPDATQTNWILGAPGYRVGDPVTPQATVMNTLWGGRFTSWLNTELRIKRGLTYGANSRFQSWGDGGIFQASSYTKNDQIGQMLDITFDLLKRAVTQGFPAEEVESARNYILGQFPPTLETNGSKAGTYVRLAFYDLGFEYYDRYLGDVAKVTPQLTDQAAKSLLPQTSYVLVLVGKADEIRPLLKKYGTWEEKKISEPGF